MIWKEGREGEWYVVSTPERLNHVRAGETDGLSGFLGFLLGVLPF